MSLDQPYSKKAQRARRIGRAALLASKLNERGEAEFGTDDLSLRAHINIGGGVTVVVRRLESGTIAASDARYSVESKGISPSDARLLAVQLLELAGKAEKQGPVIAPFGGSSVPGESQ